MGHERKRLRITGLKKSLGKNLDKSWIQTTDREAKYSLANQSRLHGKGTPVAAFINDVNGVLLKHEKGILNCWRQYICDILNAATVW